MTSDKRTQRKMLIEHFENGSSITEGEAKIKYSIGRLAARVFDLRQSGYPIKGEMVTVKNQFGQDCRVKRYYMGCGTGG